jgi:hypothetical protein
MCPWCLGATRRDGYICDVCLDRQLAVVPVLSDSLCIPGDDYRLLCRRCSFPTATNVLREGYCEGCVTALSLAFQPAVTTVDVVSPARQGTGYCPTPGCGRRLRPRYKHCSHTCAKKMGGKVRGPVPKGIQPMDLEDLCQP